MKITMTIDCDNAAFEDGNDGGDEVARILRKVANRFEARGMEGISLFDANGNKVGNLEVWD